MNASNAVFIFTMLISISQVSSAMGFFSKSDDQTDGNVCLMSPVKAKVTLNGEPVENAVVTRTVDWKGKDKQADKTVTTSDGMFEFGIMESRKKESWLAEYVAVQEIVVEHHGNSYRIWEMSSREPVENAELGKPIVLECELTDEEDYPETPRGLLITNCKLK